MFGVVDGFDILIGNPPYVRQGEDKNQLIPILQKTKTNEVFTSAADPVMFIFYEKRL